MTPRAAYKALEVGHNALTSSRRAHTHEYRNVLHVLANKHVNKSTRAHTNKSTQTHTHRHPSHALVDAAAATMRNRELNSKVTTTTIYGSHCTLTFTMSVGDQHHRAQVPAPIARAHDHIAHDSFNALA